MKILHVIASVDPRGGGPIEGVFASSAVWSKHGHERHILCLDAPDAPCVRNSPVKTFAVGARRTSLDTYWGKLTRYRYSPKLVPWLRKNASGYDAIIVNGLWNYASFGTWIALRGRDVPYFVFPHGMLDPWFIKAYPIKAIVKSLFWRLFEFRVVRDARGVLFTADEERLLAGRSFTPYEAREIVVGYGARDLSRDEKIGGNSNEDMIDEHKRSRRKYILFLSRIHPKKGVDILIRAFAQLANEYSDIDLIIAGPDQVGKTDELKKLASAHGVSDRTFWPGMLTGKNKLRAFKDCLFFVLPSHQENFGIVVAEALSVGKPVLITNKVNIWREVESAEAGVVVDDTEADLVRGLRYLCGLPPAAIEKMGSVARQCFLSHFDLESNAMKLIDIIRLQ